MKKHMLVWVLLFCSSINDVNSEPIDAQILLTNPKHGMVRLSPTGEFVTAYYKNKGKQSLDLFDRKTKRLLSSIDIDQQLKLENYVWLNKTQIYLTIWELGKSKAAIGTLNADYSITVKFFEVQGFLVNQLPEQPNTILFAKSRYHNAPYFDLFKVDINTAVEGKFEHAKKINHNSKKITNYIFDEVTQRILTSEYDEINSRTVIKYISAKDRKWKTLLTINDNNYTFSPVNFINANTLAVLTNKDSDKVLLREFDVANNVFGEVIFQHPLYDLSSVNYLRNGELHSVAYTENGLLKKKYFVRAEKALDLLLSTTFSSKIFYIGDKSADSNYYVLYTDSSDNPGEYFIYDAVSKKIERLLHAYPELADIKFYPSKTLKIKSNNTQIEAFLTQSDSQEFSTLLVMPHGGPIGVQESDQFNKQIQYFASRGFSVLRVNFHGSGGFGKAFLERGVGQFGRLIEEDITAAVNQVRSQFKYDHVCSIGSSYGGYSAVMLAIKHPNQYECVIGAYGIYDIPLLFNISNFRSGESRKKLIEKVVGQSHDEFIDISPVYIFDQLKAPILLIASHDDDVADFEHTNRFQYVLDYSGHPVEKLYYHKAGHDSHAYWSGDWHQNAVIYDFLIRTLNLNIPPKDELTTAAKNAIGNDYARIADAYFYAKNIDKELFKAVSYYEQAIKFDNPRAFYNLGSVYYHGTGADKDLEKSVEFYKKSADLGYAPAYAELGRMYLDGDHLEQSWSKALHNLKAAIKIEGSSFNKIRLGQFYCLAPSEYVDVDRCLELLDPANHKKSLSKDWESAKTYLDQILPIIVAEANVQTAEYNKILEFAVKTYKATKVKFKIKHLKSGTFQYQSNITNNKRSEFESVSNESTVFIDGKASRSFGARFKVNPVGVDMFSDRIVAAGRWILTTPDGHRQLYKSMILAGPPSNQWNVLLKIHDKLPEGDWKIEIYSLDQNLVLKEEFKTTRGAHSH